MFRNLTERLCGVPVERFSGGVPRGTVPAIALCLLVSASAIWRYGPHPRVAGLAVFGCCLVLLSLSDIERRVIPNGLLALSAVARLVDLVLFFGATPWDGLAHVLGLAVQALVLATALFATARVMTLFWGKAQVGAGDIKLVATATLYLGIFRALAMLFLGSVLGIAWWACLVAAPYVRERLRMRRAGEDGQARVGGGRQPALSRTFAWGPSLSLACWLLVLAGGVA